MKQVLFILIWLSAFSANAATFSFTGNLRNDDDVQLVNFSVAAPSTVTLRTWSYAGGTNAAGNVIPAGGFDPILTLFDSAGNWIAENDDGGGDVDPDPVTGQQLDSFLTDPLLPGSYIVAVTQYGNFAEGSLADGFPGSGTTGFRDYTDAIRTSFWALDILGADTASIVPPAAVPIPAAVWLFGSGLLGLVGIKRKPA